MTNNQQPTTLRNEWLWLLAIIIAAALLRGVHPERMQVEHFDEGVYASNWYCNHPPLTETHEYPKRYLYAPPLWPALLEWSLIFSGSNPHAVMWVNVAIGTLLVLAVWWVTRDWCGPRAALLAAALIALNESHIFFSRTALTDPLLCLWLTLGVGVGVRAITTGHPLTIAVAGCLAALAWWTKYNGWLTLAITGAGTAGWLLFDSQITKTPRDRHAAVYLFRWLLIAIVACGLWSPVLFDLDKVGGYATVSANHAGYFVGLAGWWNSAVEQSIRHWNMQGELFIVVVVVAFATLIERNGGLNSQTAGSRGWLLRIMGAVILVVISAIGYFFVALTLLALTGIALRIVSPCPHRNTSTCDSVSQETVECLVRFRLGAWSLAAWLIGLTLATPLYAPYPRLLLPWIIAALIGVSCLIGHGKVAEKSEVTEPSSIWPRVFSFGCVSLGAVIFIVKYSPELPQFAWPDRSAITRLASDLANATTQDAKSHPAVGIASGGQRLEAVIYVFADPALFYHLSSIEPQTPLNYVTQPAGDLGVTEPGSGDPRLATYLVTGIYSEPHQQQIEQASTSLELVAEFPYRASSVVRLDEDNLLGRKSKVGGRTIRLFRVRHR